MARRFNEESRMQGLRFADLEFDAGQRRVWRGKSEIELPKLSFDLLAALIEAAPNSLSTDELMDRVWQDAVVSPATVAKRVELLRQALGDDSDEPRYIALVRGHGYRLIPGVGPADAMAQKSRKPLVVTVVAALVIAAFALQYFSSRDVPPPDKSIAVLPFVSMTEVPGDEIFADGLTEELSHALARMSDLKVTGRTSSFYFKGRNEDLREIGETLGVAHVLEGSVRRSGDQLRVTAQLISADDGFHLWSEAYEREMSDVIEIQKDIAQNVAAKMRVSILDDSSTDGLADIAISPEAYALYLEAVSQSPYGKGVGLGEAQALVERVNELAPDFAPGWNRLAAIHGRRLFFGDPSYGLTPQQSLGIMHDAVQKALALDPYSGEVYANQAGIAWVFERDAAKAAPLIERALELDPWNLDLVSFAADFAKHIGKLEEALELEELLVARDPLCETCRLNLTRSYMFAGRYDEAEQQFRTMQSRGGGFHWSLGVVLLMKKLPEQALESFNKHNSFEYLKLQGRAMALHDLGQTEESRKALGKMRNSWGHEYPNATAQALAWVGELDEAFEWLERSLPEGTADLQTSFPHPLYDPFRGDPRWQEVLTRIGRTPEQMKKIPFSLDTARERLRP